MYCVSCVLESHSHNLSESAFSILMGNDNLSQVRKVDSRYLELITRADKKYFATADEFYLHAHAVASIYLMALNIASFGHFTWANGTQQSPVYGIEHEDNSRSEIVFLPEIKYPLDKVDISENEVKVALKLAGALLKEEDQSIRMEYIKGIIHLGTIFGDVDFYKESFSNFYRLFEYLVTKRILNKKKLVNERKELRSIILGELGNESAEEFDNLYRLRSEQVMHAQKKQVKILLDDLLKMKCMLDCILFRYYSKIADDWMLQHHKEYSTEILFMDNL